MLRIGVGALAVAMLASCSSRQLYGAGQQWQRVECNRIDDRDERARCAKSAATSYEQYKSQTNAAKQQ